MRPLSDNSSNSFGTATISFDLSPTQAGRDTAALDCPGATRCSGEVWRHGRRSAASSCRRWHNPWQPRQTSHEARTRRGSAPDRAAEDAAERVVARNAVRQRQELLQKLPLRAAEQRHVRAVSRRTAPRTAQSQHLVQQMAFGIARRGSSSSSKTSSQSSMAPLPPNWRHSVEYQPPWQSINGFKRCGVYGHGAGDAREYAVGESGGADHAR